jgi:hypothetical protein
LGGGELLFLPQVTDFDTRLAISIAQGGRVIFLLDMDIGILGGAAYEALEAADGVLEVGNLLCLGCLSEVSALGTKTNKSAVLTIWRLVGSYRGKEIE